MISKCKRKVIIWARYFKKPKPNKLKKLPKNICTAQPGRLEFNLTVAASSEDVKGEKACTR